MQANRRQVFAALLAAAAARQVKGADGGAIPGKRPMILHNDRPEDLETPVKYFDSWVTPVDAFFVRQHLPRPAAIDAAAYRLNLNGMVSKTAPGEPRRSAEAAAAHGPGNPGMHRQRTRLLHPEAARNPVGTRRGGQRRMERTAPQRRPRSWPESTPSAKFLEIDGADSPVYADAGFRALHADGKGDAPGHAAGAQDEWPDRPISTAFRRA